ncbi:unnamed protein product [Effrenium voratum]|uniref:Uncharacterized protein n=1 Tax=Effrenium voratum TaxID=2562239 RepID=A0AA36J615_9DINO|nr:unnamed protein product [Effrenium voratum]
MFAFDFDALELASAGPKKEAKVSPRETKCSETQRPGPCDSAPALPSPAKGPCAAARAVPSPSTEGGDRGKDPRVIDSTRQRLQRWEHTCGRLVDMVREMSHEFVAGQGYMEGMQHLIENTPRDHVGRRYRLDDFAGPLLRDHFIQWTSSHSRAEAFRKVILRLEMKVVVATKHLDLRHDWTLQPGAWDEDTVRMAEQLGATRLPPFDGFTHMKRGLLFVGLPLRLYLADSPHLYELIRRMRGLDAPSASPVRERLDGAGLSYSVLVFALLGGLQALHAARLSGKRGGRGAQGLDGLMATARRSEGAPGPGGAAFEVKEVDDNPLIFRGIWVPQRIDEVSWVLDFYAVEPTGNVEVAQLAWQESHVLLYVARFHGESSTWAFPVQFFNSGLAADVEKELVVLPFVHYEYEKIQGELFEVRSSMPRGMQRSALWQMEHRWGVSFAEHAPQMLELLEGGGLRDYGGLNRKLKVTVRFIKEIKPCKPILDLMAAGLGPPENLLLAFPPRDPEATDVKSVFGAGFHELNKLVKPGELKPLGTFVPGQKIIGGDYSLEERLAK